MAQSERYGNMTISHGADCRCGRWDKGIMLKTVVAGIALIAGAWCVAAQARGSQDAPAAAQASADAEITVEMSDHEIRVMRGGKQLHRHKFRNRVVGYDRNPVFPVYAIYLAKPAEYKELVKMHKESGEGEPSGKSAASMLVFYDPMKNRVIETNASQGPDMTIFDFPLWSGDGKRAAFLSSAWGGVNVVNVEDILRAGPDADFYYIDKPQECNSGGVFEDMRWRGSDIVVFAYSTCGVTFLYKFGFSDETLILLRGRSGPLSGSVDWAQEILRSPLQLERTLGSGPGHTDVGSKEYKGALMKHKKHNGPK